MARGEGEPSAKRAKVDEAKEEEDPLVRRREELVRLLVRARRAKGSAGVKKELLTLCAKLETKNEKLLGRLLPELWQKILDEYLDQNDLVALAMTCRFFREKQKDLGWKMETKLGARRLLELRRSGKMASHSLGWFRWVCDTMEIRPGSTEWRSFEGAVYEGNLVNYAAFQGSVEILRWLMEEKEWETNWKTGWWAGLGGNVEVLEYLLERGYEFLTGLGYEFNENACAGAAFGGRLEALKFLRGLDPPCPWDEWTCIRAAEGGHLDVLKWAREQDPPCTWSADTCTYAAKEGHLDVLKWLRAQDPPCPWSEWTYSSAARGGHLDVLKFLRSEDPPCPWDEAQLTRWLRP
ncbi:putative ankyrin repeat protein [Chloropicon roscoffensis]|uniref:Ankyrin repeat protein n=1 Tax=Chloropicon roscoffensis TaxID=1461544 RepID=A0AAX4PAC0_9CHLO